MQFDITSLSKPCKGGNGYSITGVNALKSNKMALQVDF